MAGRGRPPAARIYGACIGICRFTSGGYFEAAADQDHSGHGHGHDHGHDLLRLSWDDGSGVAGATYAPCERRPPSRVARSRQLWTRWAGRLARSCRMRILLTGQSNLDSAIAAVNHGQVFRFLTKPCSPQNLLAAIQSAAEQHRLITAERELLEKTLRGSIKALIEIL